MFKLAIKYFEILNYDNHNRFVSTIVHGFTIDFKKNNQPVVFADKMVILKKMYLDYISLIIMHPGLKDSLYSWLGFNQPAELDATLQYIAILY